MTLDPEHSTALLNIHPPRSIQDLMNADPYHGGAKIAPSYENLTIRDQCTYNIDQSTLDQARSVQDGIDRHFWKRRPILGITPKDEFLDELLDELLDES
jgi:hypothetical protein